MSGGARHRLCLRASLLVALGLTGFAVGACQDPIISETAEVHVRLDPDTRIAHVYTTRRHVESTDADSSSQGYVFDALLEFMTTDGALLDAADDRTYLRDRRLYLEDSVLCLSYEQMAEDVAWIEKGADPVGPFDARSRPDSLRFTAPDDDSVVATNGVVTAVPETSFVLRSASLTGAGGSGPAVGPKVAYEGGHPVISLADSIPNDAFLEPVLSERAVITWPNRVADKWVIFHSRSFRDQHGFVDRYLEWARRARPHAGAAAGSR